MLRHPINAVVCALLRSPASRLLDSNVLLVHYTGRRTGREVELPVGYLRDGERLLVVVGAAQHKTWWRNFATPRTVALVLRRAERTAVAQLLPLGSPEMIKAVEVVQAARPRTRINDDQRILELRPNRDDVTGAAAAVRAAKR